MTDRQELAREARGALGLSQRKFAALLGVPQATVARWEIGERNPGAVGEAFFRLVLDSPTRSQRVLKRAAQARDETPE